MIILNKEKGIISLAVVLTVGFFALSMAMINSMGALTELAKNRNTGFGENAFYNAEAAAGYGVYKYLENYTNGSSSYSGGDNLLINNSTSTIYVDDDEENWPYVEIRGEAQNQRTFRGVSYMINVFPEGLAFNHAIFSKNNLSLGGDSSVNGDVFVQNKLNFTGNKAAINGDVYYTKEIDGNNINGETYFLSKPIPAPQIDLDYYWATATCPTIDVDEAENCVLNATKEEIVFASTTDELKIKDNKNTNFTGTIVTEGNLEIGVGTYTAGGDPLVIVVKGNLTITGSAEINGIIYVFGTISFTGGTPRINGSLILVNEQNDAVGSQNGTPIINYQAEYANNWQEIGGLNTASSATPTISNWKEF